MNEQIRKLTALAELVASISRYDEEVLSDPIEDEEAEQEALLAIARAFLRFCGLPGRADEMYDQLRSGQALPPMVREQAQFYRKIPIPSELRWLVFRRDNFTCKSCGIQANLQADHIVPESKGGPTTLENLQTLCRDCNVKKGTRA